MARDYKKLPNCLRKFRKGSQLSQKEVARILGLKNTAIISRWERGVSMPSSIYLFKLASIYGRLIEDLFIDHYRAIKDEILGKKKILNHDQ